MSQPQKPAAAKYRVFPGLDGLRAIAVLLVLIYHLLPDALPGGFLGVDVFFAISGFLITSLILREHTISGSINLPAFWQRRARRLLPALFLTLLVCSAVASIFGGDLLYALGGQLFSTVFFVSNWFFVASGADYFTKDTPELFRNTWSLGVEEQFYLLLPLVLLFLLRRPSRRKLIAVLGSLGLLSATAMHLLSLGGSAASRIYFGSDTHSFGLIFGAVLAIILHTAPHPYRKPGFLKQTLYLAGTVIGIGGLLTLAFTLHEDSSFIFQGGILSATLLSLLTVAVITRDGSLPGRLFDNPVMRYIGMRSYGIYLWHWPILVITDAAFGPGEGTLRQLTVATIVAASTFAIAHLSFRFVEQPIRRHGIRGVVKLAISPRAHNSRARLILACLVAVSIVCVPATGWALANQPAKTSTQIAIERGEKAAAEAKRKAQEAAQQAAKQEAAKAQAAAQAAADFDPTAPVLPSGTQISAIGDSVMLAAAGELYDEFPGIELDAAVSRSMTAGLELAKEQSAAGTLRETVVFGLGTNGAITDADLAYICELAKTHRIVLINAHAERDWIPGVNEALARVSTENRGIALADWTGSVSPHPELLAGDGIHPHPAGGTVYAESIRAALGKLVTDPAEMRRVAIPRF
ncbi:acyltransferase family protein [Canibacter zhoujuaniae]|uniref:acyltransferase family protein n=1 Tax=Canibacter zhoujuaniae TaxID=2708343 RepID=UPI0014242EB1|nr:acyltransferase family protein [Canibacter zhoujuaniae]